MAFGKIIRTWFDGAWHDGDVPVMRAADHGMWQGSSVFDGARRFEGMTPDLDKHCARVNRSAEALMLRPTKTPDQMVEIIQEGLKGFAPDAAIYIRPMYWGIHGSELGLVPSDTETGFAICLEEVPMYGP
ncbi:MAG: aminotransferase class IV, partial [Pseudomonadota bacterium]